MRTLLATNDLRLSSRLFLANTLTGLALLLIAGYILLAFAAVRDQSATVATEDIESVVGNARMTRSLSRVFFEMDRLDRTFLQNTDLLRSQGQRLSAIIEQERSVATDRQLIGFLVDLDSQFVRFLLQAEAVNEVLQSGDATDRRLNARLTELEAIISDWLIESTLSGEDTDFVTQQLTLINGFRESLLTIGRLYSELSLNLSTRLIPNQDAVLTEAIDDLALRLQTITASTPEVARYGRELIDDTLGLRRIVERIRGTSKELNSIRADLAETKARTVSAMERIDQNVTSTARSAAARIEKIINWAGTVVVLSTLLTIALIFFATRRLIDRNIHGPMQTILDGIAAFRAGDLHATIALERHDEWNTVARSLMEMAVDLDRSRSDLREANRGLERRVEKRTRELAAAVKALSASEQSLLEAQRIAHLGHWSWNLGTGHQVWSEEQYRIFGLDPSETEASYERMVGSLHPEDDCRVRSTLSQAVESRTGFASEFRIVRNDGSIRWIEAQGMVSRTGDHEPEEMAGTVLDITERKRIERLLYEEKERALVTLHSIGDAVIATDARGMVEYLNPVAERMTGYKLAEVRGLALKQVFRIINEDTRDPADDPVARCLREGKIIGLANHTVLVSKSGAEYAIQDSAAPIQDPAGVVLGVVLVFSDVTEARRLSRQVSYDACHDGLTSLPNRQEFKRRLDRVVTTARTEATANVLCYIDLDQFKLINDTCGHVAGDEVLRQMGDLLRNNVRHRDTIARLGGDEFGLLMEHCAPDEARQVLNKLINTVAEHEFLWEGKRFKIGLSIGLVAVNESSNNSNGLLSAADTACMMAKEQGGSRYHVYQENDEELAKRHGEMQWAVRLPDALKENRFRLFVQPIVPVLGDAEEGEHYEVLIRLEDDTIVMPSAFYPAADRYQLSCRLDRWVIENTFQWIVDHPEHLRSLRLCSINLSGHSLNEESFLGFVNQKFENLPIPPDRICFEITETVAIANFSRATKFMDELKRKGCRFALDDFGSGLSSFAYLKTLPVDYLKIDGFFVRDILDDELDLAFVRAITEIAKILGVKTIAEFVESEAILEKIRGIGVDYAQGFAVGRPRPIGELARVRP